MLLKELGLSGKEEPASLSGGEARRAALARALAPLPDILLLESSAKSEPLQFCLVGDAR
jgi:ATP-binding cassette subfamily F protein uup